MHTGIIGHGFRLAARRSGSRGSLRVRKHPWEPDDPTGDHPKREDLRPATIGAAIRGWARGCIDAITDTRYFWPPFSDTEERHVTRLRLLTCQHYRPDDRESGHRNRSGGFAVSPTRTIVETVSGSVPASERKGFALLLNKVEAGDVLVATKPDRPGRKRVAMCCERPCGADSAQPFRAVVRHHNLRVDLMLPETSHIKEAPCPPTPSPD